MSASGAHAPSTQPKPIANPNYTPLAADPAGYGSFESFYPFYLGEHANAISRRLHLIGTSISLLTLLRVTVAKVSSAQSLQLKAAAWKYIVGAFLQGYLFAWVGHFFFERNKPATFKYPLYSLRGDFKLLAEVVTLKRSP